MWTALAVSIFTYVPLFFIALGIGLRTNQDRWCRFEFYRQPDQVEDQKRKAISMIVYVCYRLNAKDISAHLPFPPVIPSCISCLLYPSALSVGSAASGVAKKCYLRQQRSPPNAFIVFRDWPTSASSFSHAQISSWRAVQIVGASG
jgi:hypothetical protein